MLNREWWNRQIDKVKKIYVQYLQMINEINTKEFCIYLESEAYQLLLTAFVMNSILKTYVLKKKQLDRQIDGQIHRLIDG